MSSQPKICLIHAHSKIEALYTLFPLIVSRYSRRIQLLHMQSAEARTAEGDCAILLRTFKGNDDFADDNEKKRAYVQDVKKRFNRVVVLDDGAGSDSLHYEYMDLVDLYYKGKLLRDKSIYLRPTYGRQVFTDYYKNKFGVTDEKEKLRDCPPDPSVLQKLRVSWNLGMGVYPVPGVNWIRLAKGATRYSLSKALKPWFVYSHKKMVRQVSQPVNSGAKVKKVHARFGYKSFPNTVGYQRKIFLERCNASNYAVVGNVQPKVYNREIRDIGAVLSPYGWGEICYRDFEAVSNGSLLIKPNMDHIDTWPNIYQSGVTYLPVDWDGDDLQETLGQVAGNISGYAGMAEAARETYRQALLSIDERMRQFLEEASGRPVD